MMRNRNSWRSMFRGPKDYIAVAAVLVVIALAIFGLYHVTAWVVGTVKADGVPEKYRSNVWFQVGDIWVQPGQTAIVLGNNYEGDYASVSVRINNNEKYRYEVQRANGSYEPVKEQTRSVIATGPDGSTRWIHVYDRATGKQLEPIKIVVQTE